MKKKLLPILILFMGFIYIFIIPDEPVLVNIAFKIIPMLLILYYAFINKLAGTGKYSIIILIGLFFCMLGDGLLYWFVIGLTAFLIGHLFYIGGFLTRWDFSLARFLSIIPVAIYAIIIGHRLVTSIQNDSEHGLIIPVILYITVISLMFWSAMMTGNKSAIFGSALFIVSDSVLAWNKFVSEILYSGEIIMITYYTAQFLIARSLWSQLSKQQIPSHIENKSIVDK